jgi:hypothetical protein
MKIKWEDADPNIDNGLVCSAIHDGRKLEISDDSCRGVVTLHIEELEDERTMPRLAFISFQTDSVIDVELAKYCAQRIVDEQDKPQ